MVDRSISPSGTTTGRLLFELAVLPLVLLSPVLNAVGGLAVSWVWLGVGAVVTGVGAGATVAHLDERTTERSPAQFLVATVVVVVVWAGIVLLRLPPESIDSFVLGSTAVLVAMRAGRVLDRLTDASAHAAG